MRTGHMEGHRTGQLAGEIPPQWLSERRLVPCRICDKLVTGAPGAVHPRCAPAARTEQDRTVHAQTVVTRIGLGVVPAEAGLPSAAEVMSSQRATMKHVPKACRARWTSALTRALVTVYICCCATGLGATPEALARCDNAWAELLMLPKAVLNPSPRHGRRHHNSAANYTSARLQRWLDGERSSLWAEGPAHTPGQSKRKKESKEMQTARTLNMVSEGRLSAVCANSDSRGTADNNQATWDALKAKHRW